MPSTRNWQRQLIEDFGGAWTYRDPPDVPSGRALHCKNIDFREGAARSRLGFLPAVLAGEAITTLFNWVGPRGNLLLWHRALDGAIRYCDLAAPTTINTLVTLGGVGASFVNAGSRCYVCAYDASGVGVGHARVISYQSGSYQVDTCFAPPLTYTPSAPTEPSAGEITAGVHSLAYRIEYRNGYVGKLCPVNASTEQFTPVSFTAAGAKNATWTLNTAWPAGAVRVHVCLSTVNNRGKFIMVPGASAAVTGGTTHSVAITFDWSDDRLLSSAAEDATFAQLAMTQTIAGAAPIAPSKMVAYGNRIVYVCRISDGIGGTVAALLISNPDNFQALTLDQNLKQLPAQIDFVTAETISSSLYVFGPNGTHRTTDNGAEPITWANLEKIDDRRGTLSIHGVEAAAAGAFAWVADRTGLYAFEGVYPDKPVSFEQTDIWDRINWSAANRVQVKDHPTSKTVYVMAPLDGATEPTHLLAWNYDGGRRHDRVRFTFVEITNRAPGAIEIVQNGLPSMASNIQRRFELWVAPGSAVNLIPNSSFEAGSDGWYLGTGWSRVADGNARTGSYSLKKLTSGAGQDAIRIYAHEVVPGQQLCVEGWVKAVGGADGFALVGINYFDGSSVFISGDYQSVAAAGAGSFARIAVASTVPVNARFAKPLFSTTSQTTGSWYCDDIAMYGGSILREAGEDDTSPYRDDEYPVLAEIEPALMPPKKAAATQILRHHGVGIRATGSGELADLLSGLDRNKQFQLRRITLSNSPGAEAMRLFDLFSEGASHRLSNNLAYDPLFTINGGYWSGPNFSIVENASALTGPRVLKHTGLATNDNCLQLNPNTGEKYYISVTPGERFLLEGWVKVDELSSEIVMIYLAYYDSGGVNVAFSVVEMAKSLTWRRSAQLAIIPAGVVSMHIGMAVQGKIVTSGTWFDNISLVKVDSRFSVSSLQHFYTPYASTR